nr:hypothetical protein Iba_chr06aCG4520 [Ipomoea batatas]
MLKKQSCNGELGTHRAEFKSQARGIPASINGTDDLFVQGSLRASDDSSIKAFQSVYNRCNGSPKSNTVSKPCCERMARIRLFNWLTESSQCRVINGGYFNLCSGVWPNKFLFTAKERLHPGVATASSRINHTSFIPRFRSKNSKNWHSIFYQRQSNGILISTTSLALRDKAGAVSPKRGASARHSFTVFTTPSSSPVAPAWESSSTSSSATIDTFSLPNASESQEKHGHSCLHNLSAIERRIVILGVDLLRALRNQILLDILAEQACHVHSSDCNSQLSGILVIWAVPMKQVRRVSVHSYVVGEEIGIFVGVAEDT